MGAFENMTSDRQTTVILLINARTRVAVYTSEQSYHLHAYQENTGICDQDEQYDGRKYEWILRVAGMI